MKKYTFVEIYVLTFEKEDIITFSGVLEKKDHAYFYDDFN